MPTLEETARLSYGKLLAFLARDSGDLSLAEDALSEAFLSAIRTWPVSGTPENPEAWLLRAAKNRLVDHWRRLNLHREKEEILRLAMEEDSPGPSVPDRRLELLFVCAHPAIDPGIRTPLMLQTVLGIDVARMAPAFLCQASTLAQRLVRAKTKIRDAGIRFAIPETSEWGERLPPVLDAIYASYTLGWEPTPDHPGSPLESEAVFLARIAADLLPSEPEAQALLSILLHIEARKAARLSGDGRFIPLANQDTALWNDSLMHEAESRLRKAASFKQPGRYQWEASIQSLHAERKTTGKTQWPVIAGIYGLLLAETSSIGAQIARAIATAEAGNPEEALRLLHLIPENRVASHQPYWVAKASLLDKNLQFPKASSAWSKAIQLTSHPALKKHLELQKMLSGEKK